MTLERKLITACEDCGLPYQDFPLDLTLSDEQWLLIHPTGVGGLLCAQCIVTRAATLKGAVAVRARIALVHVGRRTRWTPRTLEERLGSLRAWLARHQGDLQPPPAWPAVMREALDLASHNTGGPG